MLRLTILLLLFSTKAICQIQITWETLSDVTFTDKYSKEVDANYYYPHFGSSVKALKGEEVVIEGYIIVLEQNSDTYILSKNPFSSCFFCGKAGPESILEVQISGKHRRLSSDQIVSIRGTLRLNKDDIYHCNYILENASIAD